MSPKEISNNAKLLKLLGHNKRLEIITLLHGHQLTVGQIAQMTALRQAAVSQHLMLLKRSHLVTSQSIGKEIYYSLSSDRFVALSLYLDCLTRTRPASDVEPTVIDPICHMQLTPSTAYSTCEYNGVRHYFCGLGCQKEFHANH